MPVFTPPYLPALPLRNGHVNTIWSYLNRKADKAPFERETLYTPDGDFLVLDWWKTGSDKCAVLVHGLEGDASSTYLLTLASQLNALGWDVVCMNQRGCSGVPNWLYRSYHSGAIDDLETVLKRVSNDYACLAAIGFSLGGNVLLRYLGAKPEDVPSALKMAIAVSVPCHLSSACDTLAQWQNKVYSHRFVVSLKKKLAEKQLRFPEMIQIKDLARIRTIRDFDEAYTAPANGFLHAEDYYAQCSSLFFLHTIQLPTLLINAQDDPFLSPQCYPWKEANQNPNLQVYIPRYGGHVGFWPERGAKQFKHEQWILEFLNTQKAV